jgi:signal transduction histidine kinase
LILSAAHPIFIDELIDGCVAGYRIAYSSRKFELQLGSSQAAVNGSPELFAQMLDKIVNNAVEFSRHNANIIILR